MFQTHLLSSGSQRSLRRIPYAILPLIFFLGSLTRPIKAEAFDDHGFTEIYGKRVRQADTIAKKIALAKAIVADAETVSEPEVKAVLYEKAYDLGRVDPSGYGTCVAAMESLISAVPEKDQSAQQKIISIYELEFRAANSAARHELARDYLARLTKYAAIQLKAKDQEGAKATYHKALPVADVVGAAERKNVEMRLNHLTAESTAQKRADALQKTLASTPDDTKSASDLIRIYLLELDQPDEAKKYIGVVNDSELKNVIVLANIEIEELSEQDAITLAQWYKSQCDKESSGNKAVAASRAYRCFERFLAVRTSHDLAWLKAKKDLSALPPGEDTIDTPKLEVLSQKTQKYGGQSANYAKYKDLTFDVGIGSYGPGWGAGSAGIEIAHAMSLSVAVARPLELHNQNLDSFAGVLIDYHTANGYTNRVALAMGVSGTHHGGDSAREIGSRSEPARFVDLGEKASYWLNLAEYAPKGWDGRVWFIVAIENTGSDTSFQLKIVGE